MALTFLGTWYHAAEGNCEVDGQCDLVNVPMGLSPKMQSDPDDGATVAAWLASLVAGMIIEMREGSNKRRMVISSAYMAGAHIEVNGTVTDTGTINTDVMFDLYSGTDATPTITLSVTPSSISENVASATVVATADITPASDVTVTLAISGTAVKDTDYSMSDTSILIPSGQLTGGVTVVTFDNTVYEPSKTAIFDIDGVTGGTEDGTQQTTLTITSNDPQPTVNLSRSNALIAENGGTSYISATLTNPSVDDLTVSFTLAGTAVENTDYTTSTDTIIITAGNTSGSISVTALSDTLAEGNQTVIFDFSVDNGIKGSTTSITIVDDDPLITLDSDILTFHEADDVATIFALSSFTKASDITVNLVFTGTATDVDDYSRSGSSITIPSGNTSGSMQIIALVDALSDPDETIIVSIGTVTGGVEDGTQSLTLTILEVPEITPSPTTLPGLGYKIGLGL